MKRREVLKTLAVSAAAPRLLAGSFSGGLWDRLQSAFGPGAAGARSRWDRWPDMAWAGPAFWGNRLQDWQLRDGQLRCAVSGKNRTLHWLTQQLSGRPEAFETSVGVELLAHTNSPKDYIGFRLGAKGKFEDYRSAAVFGKGLDAGLTTAGRLFVGNQQSPQTVPIPADARLQLRAIPQASGYTIELTLHGGQQEEPLAELSAAGIGQDALTGNMALVSHFESKGRDPQSTSARFGSWRVEGNKVETHPERAYGPVCFAQYTLHQQTLKMTAQLAPIEAIDGHEVQLQLKRGYGWQTVQTQRVHPRARTTHFRLEGWHSDRDVPYRLKVELPLADGAKSYYYEGTLAADPVETDKLKTAVFSCNAQFGFPNQEVVDHVGKHSPDMAVFLGDQFYESHGGFGIQRSPLDKACLDYLRKWYMFGWSYREIFRDIPSAFIPDDHDVYHGNIWGEGGKEAPTDEGWGYVAQDQGGYKMPAEWVNVVQRTQTSNLPDAYDPTPVKQDISVYYTDWTFGGVSFAILEDRKFKSAPKNVLPKEAQVKNGFIQNPNFDITQQYDIDADLLGERQLKFLEHWAADWSGQAQMKAVLSQTPFCTLATLPEGSLIDEVVPSLEIPPRGKYVQGDAPVTDMDSGGWPQKGRDKAIRRMRKGRAFHIAGDQHLGSTVEYGIDEHGDAGFAFAGPALNNIWPRRWWPQVPEAHKPLPGQPKNTGNFTDGFGNLMSVYAVANPVQTDREPSIIYDRATGYGMVTFDKAERTIRIECWPRYVDPESNPEGQYDGWPLVVHQQDNDGRRPVTYLPTVKVNGMQDPVVQVYRQEDEELVYALRINGSSFRPKVYDRTAYKLRVGDPDRDRWQSFEKVSPSDTKPLQCDFN